jgi:3'-5' exoribonuclease
MSGDRVDTVVSVARRDLRLSRNGEPYLWLELSDRSGSIQAVRFAPRGTEIAIPEGTVARVLGRVGTWRGDSRIRVTGLEPAPSYDRGDLLPSTIADLDELKSRLRAHVAGVGDPALRALVRAVFAAPGFAHRFAECPASGEGHHPWLGGLIEHTDSVCDHVMRFASAYPQVDGDLLLAAALVHDVGRVDELEFETGIGLTLEGRLAGHVTLGLRRFDNAAAAMRERLPSRRLAALRHAVAVHEGDGPEQAVTLEALLLAHADRTDRETTAFITAVGRAIRAEDAWTGDDNLLGRPLLASPSGVADSLRGAVSSRRTPDRHPAGGAGPAGLREAS